MQQPPPIPTKRSRIPRKILWLSVGALTVVFYLLIFGGRLRVYSIPTDGMKPTLSHGDHVIMEGVTYLFRAPRPGEIAVFRTDGLWHSEPGRFYAQRVAGVPGDRVRISDGKLYVNDKHLPLANSAGEIIYANMPTSRFLTSSIDSLVVPDGYYFLLGDNSLHSFDGRFLGLVPASNIRGRIILHQ